MRAVKMCQRSGRRDQRIRAVIDGTVDGAPVITIDISLTGVAVTAAPSADADSLAALRDFDVGARVDVSLRGPDGVCILRAEVVRVDDGVVGMAWSDDDRTYDRVERLLRRLFCTRAAPVKPALAAAL